MASDQTPSKIAEKFGAKDVFTAIGMMSGTSMDGIDVALVRSDGAGMVDKLASAEYPYEAAFRERLAESLEIARTISKDKVLPKALLELETEITMRHGEAVRRFLDDQGRGADEVDLIGFHGQTVLHRPYEGFTVQLGDGQLLANETGIACVYDMRSNDMAHGGQGAPLVPVFHKALAEGLGDRNGARLPVAFVNIGGISNISYVGKSAELIAFDIGPGNALIDQWMQSEAGISYDQGGAIASEGGVIVRIAERYLAESFFEQTIPKSLDRNDFRPLQRGEASLEDGARTLAHISAAAIIKACDHLPEPPELWIICGGGRKNAAIMVDLKQLAREKNGAEVILAEEADLDGDSMEAEAWAYLAIRSVKNLPLTFPMTTGCKVPVSGGRLAFPQA